MMACFAEVTARVVAARVSLAAAGADHGIIDPLINTVAAGAAAASSQRMMMS